MSPAGRAGGALDTEHLCMPRTVVSIVFLYISVSTVSFPQQPGEVGAWFSPFYR